MNIFKFGCFSSRKRVGFQPKISNSSPPFSFITGFITRYSGYKKRYLLKLGKSNITIRKKYGDFVVIS